MSVLNNIIRGPSGQTQLPSKTTLPESKKVGRDQRIDAFLKGGIYRSGATPHLSGQVPKMWIWDEPTYIGFDVRFVFHENDNTLRNNFDSLGNPLLMDFSWETSAASYLENIGEVTRSQQLITFRQLLLDINRDSPWYFQKLDGVESLYKIEPGKNIRVQDGAITIECLESFDWRIAALGELYRNIVWDSVHNRWMLPENMRYFKCIIEVFDYRQLQRTKDAFEEKFSYQESALEEWSAKQAAKLSGVMGKITSNPVGAAVVKGLSGAANTLKTAATIAVQQNTTNSSNSLINKISNSALNVVREMAQGDAEMLPAALSFGDETMKPNITIVCDMCEFQFLESGPKFVNGIAASPDEAPAVGEIKFKVGKVNITTNFTPFGLEVTDNIAHWERSKSWGEKKMEVPGLNQEDSREKVVLNVQKKLGEVVKAEAKNLGLQLIESGVNYVASKATGAIMSALSGTPFLGNAYANSGTWLNSIQQQWDRKVDAMLKSNKTGETAGGDGGDRRNYEQQDRSGELKNQKANLSVPPQTKDNLTNASLEIPSVLKSNLESQNIDLTIPPISNTNLEHENVSLTEPAQSGIDINSQTAGLMEPAQSRVDLNSQNVDLTVPPQSGQAISGQNIELYNLDPHKPVMASNSELGAPAISTNLQPQAGLTPPSVLNSMQGTDFQYPPISENMSNSADLTEPKVIDNLQPNAQLVVPSVLTDISGKVEFSGPPS